MERIVISDLTDFELALLRKLDGKYRAMPWGATMTSAIERLFKEGYLIKKGDDHSVSYSLSEAGRKFVSELPKSQ